MNGPGRVWFGGLASLLGLSGGARGMMSPGGLDRGLGLAGQLMQSPAALHPGQYIGRQEPGTSPFSAPVRSGGASNVLRAAMGGMGVPRGTGALQAAGRSKLMAAGKRGMGR